MTDKQREAIGIVLQQCFEKFLDVGAALTLIDAIIETAPIQVAPLDYPPKVWYNQSGTYTETDKKESGEASKKSMLLNNTSPF